MFYRYLDNVGRRRRYDHSQQSEPGHAGLIKIANSKEPDDVRKEGSAEDPEIPFFGAIPFHRLSSDSDPGEADVNQTQKAKERCQTTDFSLSNELIGKIPHRSSPSGIFDSADKPPITEMHDEVVNQPCAVITRRAADNVNAGDQEPNRSLHYEV